MIHLGVGRADRHNMKYWYWVYGILLTGVVATGLIAGLVNAGSVLQRTIEVSLSFIVLIHLGFIALFSVLEQILPAAGPRKPWNGYLLNLEVAMLRNVTAASSLPVCLAPVRPRLVAG
jgi:hypothetical protein